MVVVLYLKSGLGHVHSMDMKLCNHCQKSCNFCDDHSRMNFSEFIFISKNFQELYRYSQCSKSFLKFLRTYIKLKNWILEPEARNFILWRPFRPFRILWMLHQEINKFVSTFELLGNSQEFFEILVIFFEHLETFRNSQFFWWFYLDVLSFNLWRPLFQ